MDNLYKNYKKTQLLEEIKQLKKEILLLKEQLYKNENKKIHNNIYSTFENFQSNIEFIQDIIEPIPIGLGIWHYEMEKINIPIFKLIALNKLAIERIYPVQIQIGKTIYETLQTPHNYEISNFFLKLLKTEEQCNIEEFTLDGKAHFSVKTFILKKYNCVGVAFQPPSHLSSKFEEIFEMIPYSLTIFKEIYENNEIDYKFITSNASGRSHRKESCDPESFTLTERVPCFKENKFIQTISNSPIGKVIHFAINLQINDYYKHGIRVGKIVKISNNQILFCYETIDENIIKKYQSILNYSTQRTKDTSLFSDIFFFNENLNSIEELTSSLSKDNFLLNYPPPSSPILTSQTINKKLKFFEQPPSQSSSNRTSNSNSSNIYLSQLNHQTNSSINHIPKYPIINHLTNNSLTFENFKIILNSLPNAMALVGTNGNFLFVNKKFSQMLGYSLEDLISCSFLAISHPSEIDISVKTLHQCLTGELQYFQKIKKYIHRQGHIISCLLSAKMIVDINGFSFFVTEFQAIETLKNLLRNSDNLKEGDYYINLFYQSNLPMCLIEKNGLIKNINKAYHELIRSFSLPIEEPYIFSFLKIDHQCIVTSIQQLFEEKISSQQLLVHVDNKTIQGIKCFLNMFCILDHNQIPLYIVSILIPITPIIQLVSHF